MVQQTEKLRKFLPSHSDSNQWRQIFEKVYFIDEKMQEKVQYAANFDFGYTNSTLENTGTGLKCSFVCHIPAIVFSNSLEEVANFVATYDSEIQTTQERVLHLLEQAENYYSKNRGPKS